MGGAKARARKQKRAREERERKKQQHEINKLPFVSICTPTYNRRPFIPYIIKTVERQTYPKERMEWIVVDDGTDCVRDLFENHPDLNIRYIRYEEKMRLGKKRNIMHDHAKGDILVYMDDDDYYPNDRVEHAVETLQNNPEAMAAGSSKIFIYFKHNKTMYTFGPYGKNHATAGTFAFRRKLLETSRYNEEASLAEEKEFLKNYTVPFVQLDPRKTILVFSHAHNTFDKRRLLEKKSDIIKISPVKVKDFIADDTIRKFFTQDIDDLLRDYAPGRPDMKPDVLKQIKEIDEKRKKQMTENTKYNGQISVKNEDGTDRTLTIQEIADLLKKQQSAIQQYKKLVEQQKQEIERLKRINDEPVEIQL
jgi:glycosyltransferase involved in cell wall biosynthesis